MGLDPRIRVCAVCGRVLDFHHGDRNGQGRGWAHTLGTAMDGQDDHPAVPASPSEVFTVGFCDFCYALDPPLELPARTFRVPVLPGMAPQESVGDWACCVECGTLIEGNRWNRLIERVTAGHERRFGEPLRPVERQYLVRMYRALRANITGPVRLSTLPTPDRKEP